MDFITWWFDAHWLAATVFTPGLAFLYALYTAQTGWAWGITGFYVGCKSLTHVLQEANK